MSYSFSFIARTKERAIELVEVQGKYPNVDRCVVDIVVSAIRALPEEGDGSSDKMISVSASGHHAIKGGSHPVTTHQIEVKPVTITE
jgi:hypothetical protein